LALRTFDNHHVHSCILVMFNIPLNAWMAQLNTLICMVMHMCVSRLSLISLSTIFECSNLISFNNCSWNTEAVPFWMLQCIRCLLILFKIPFSILLSFKLIPVAVFKINKSTPFENLDLSGFFWFSATSPSILNEIYNFITSVIREMLQIRPFDNLDPLCHFDQQDAVKLFWFSW